MQLLVSVRWHRRRGTPIDARVKLQHLPSAKHHEEKLMFHDPTSLYRCGTARYHLIGDLSKA